MREGSSGSSAPRRLRLAIPRGLVATLAPAGSLVLLRLYADVAGDLPVASRLLLLGVGVAVALSALLLSRWPTLGRLLTSASLATGGVLAVTRILANPGLTLLLAVGLIGLVHWLWTRPVPPRVETADPEALDEDLALRVTECRAAAWGALCSWLLAIPVGLATETGGQALTLAVLLYSVAKGLRLLKTERGVWRVSPLVLTGAWLIVAVATAAAWTGLPTAINGAAVAVAVLLVVVRQPARLSASAGKGAWLGVLVERPARLLVGTFLATGLLGGLALSLPACAANGKGVPVLDAMFTSFSATCVTGLVVLDTPKDFTGFGQVVILLLIQIGGLGIMTFSSAAMIFLRRRLGLRYEGAITEIVGSEGRGDLADALRRMLLVTFGLEAAGAVALAVFFLAAGDGPGMALWRALFTSVSAYCNAGFALQSDNLIPYQTWTSVLHVVAALIVLGGLSPAVITELPELARRRRLSLFGRVVLVTTGLLLVLPTALIAGLEWSTTLSGLSVWEGLSNAWFQSVTTRTAGFNSIDMLAMRSATATLMDVLMFIGGSPGGTAGGIKTTTVAILLLAVVASFRGRPNATVWGWRIGHASVYKAATVLMLGLATVLSGVLAIQLTQTMDLQVALFEVLSALGTVGLSIGGTTLLDGVGKIIIISCMFVGRVGPLTLLLSFRGGSQGDPWVLPEQEVTVG